ncbi:MAG: hypothetical protein M1839_001606 [Geoglossum umbratile]|nr:MAG: hypothetical protein M1839_001606 [Geoglossum umbratile]
MASAQPARELIRLGPNDSTYYYREADTSAPILAGLLDFANTKDLGKWLDIPAVQELWRKYYQLRLVGFGGIATKAVPIGIRDCMILWSRDSNKELLRSEDPEWNTVPAKHRPLLVTLWYSRQLVRTNPDVFSKFVGYPEGTENIARGIRCLRLMWDRKAKNMSVAPQKNQPATIVPRYMDPDLPANGCQDGSRLLVDETRQNTSFGGPVPLRKKRRLNKSSIDEIIWEIEQGLETTDESTLGTIRSETIGINPAWRLLFLREVAAKVRVLRAGGSSKQAANLHLVELDGNAAAVAESSVSVTTTDPATLALEETENFWRLQKSIASLSSANIPAYDDSKALFSVNRSGFPRVGRLTLKPWQVVGVKWMMDQEMSPVRGGIVADGCGLGKTNQTLAFLATSLRHNETSGLPRRSYRPTLIIAPPAVIQTWIDEYTDYFSDVFEMRVFHSGRYQAPWVRDATLSRAETKTLWHVGGVADPHNGMTRRLLLITTYETLARRFRVEVSSDGDHDPDPELGEGRSAWVGRFARVICDEGHKIKDRKTETWRAVSGLAARYKWVLTATPLINRITDYTGYLALFFNPTWAKHGPPDDDNPSQPYQDFLALPNTEQTIQEGLHLLDPNLFGKNIIQGDMPAERARFVLPALSHVLQLQRTTASLVDVGDGRQLRVGDDIPPFSTSTVELALDPQAQAEYRTYHDKLIGQLKRYNPASREDEDQPFVVFNNRFLRRLAHNAFSPALERFAQRISRNGVKEIEHFRQYTDNGARHFIRHTMLDWGMPVPRAASDLVEFLTNTSPKLGYLCGVLADVVLGKREKLLLFAEWPMVMWVTEMLLGLLDIPYFAIRASTKADNRTSIMRYFNDANHPTLVLLTMFRTCSLGINLQRACHRMVVLEPARNLNTLLHAIGRINRVGQAERQTVTILFCENTFNRWQEYIATEKFMAQLTGSLSADDNGTKVTEQTVMDLLGQPQPRLPMGDMQLPPEVEQDGGDESEEETEEAEEEEEEEEEEDEGEEDEEDEDGEEEDREEEEGEEGEEDEGDGDGDGDEDGEEKEKDDDDEEEEEGEGSCLVLSIKCFWSTVIPDL